MRPQPELTIRTVPVDELVPYIHNAKKHPQKQIDEIAASMQEFGNCDPIAVWHNDDGEAEIVEGHGRVLALKKLGVKEAPVIFLDHLTDEQRRAYTHIHNQTTLSSDFDDEVLLADLMELPYDFADFGFDDVIPKEEAEQNKYTQKIEGLIYQPGGRKPKPSELVYTEELDEKLQLVEQAEGISDELRAALRLACYRFAVHDYSAWADLYANGTQQERSIIEELLLVIVDYDSAIENAAVKLYDEAGDVVA